MQRRFFIVAGALALILIVAQQLALAQNCTTQSCIYLPAQQMGAGQSAPTQDPTGTATAYAQTETPPPIVGTVPLGTNGCELAAPAPVEGAQAWVVSVPQGIFTRQQLCVRLVVQGRFFYNFTAHVVLHTRTQDWAFDTTNGATGVGQLVLSAPDVLAGDTVQVDAAVPYLDRTYLAHTSYVAAFQPTITPTNTPIPPTSTSIPPTVTNVPPTATNVPPTSTPTVTNTPTATATDTPTPTP